ncbi:Protein kinase domain family protein [Leishmania donovani]|uniref:Protein kinase domain family protein n=1 Tax=Leishmania donovani TaxID=5661 RepID=A0A504XDH4_LEIDO|nr:Protein kinase domain family protein [Leishmania donovani]
MSAPATAATPPIASGSGNGTISGNQEVNPRARDPHSSQSHHAEHAGGSPRRSKSCVSMHASTAGGTAHRQVIGNYELGRVLATGDFDCRTRLCRHITTGVRYVVRVYDKRVLAEAQWMWNRVAESIRVQCTLPKNKYVLEMVECFESNTSVYMLMHLFPSINITKLFTDSAARAKLLSCLQAMSRANAHTSAAATSNGSLTTEPEKTAKGEPHRKPSHVHALPATDPTSAPKSVLSRGLKTSMRTPSASAAESQPSEHGTEETADANEFSHRGGGKQESTPSTAASTMGGASTSPMAVASVNAFLGTAVPSHVPLSLIRDLFEQAVKGVSHLHQYNVAHTGIAPDHLLVGANGLLRISNMVSCCFCAQGERLHELRGTRHTVAPEVLRGESYDPYLADAWALGVVLYFMLNRGRYPHDGASTLRHILHGRVRPSRPGLPPVALDLVSRLLQGSPEERLPVDAILTHPFFLAPLPTIAEEAAAEAAELQAQHVRHRLTTGAAVHGGHSVVSDRDDLNGRRLRSKEKAVGAGRQEASSPHWESLVTFGSGDSITGRDEVDSSGLNPQHNGDDDASAAEDGSRRSCRDTVCPPRAGLPTHQPSAASRSPSASMKRAHLAASSLARTSPCQSVAGSVSASTRPVWCPHLAPTLDALEDLAGRVIQYHYRQMKRRQQYRAETRTLVARSQSMRRAKVEEEGIGGQQQPLLSLVPAVVVLSRPPSLDLVPSSAGTVTPKRDERKPVMAANVLDAAAGSQSPSSARRRASTNNSVDTGGPLEDEPLSHWHKCGTASPASTIQSVLVTGANSVVIGTRAGSPGSLDRDDDGTESSLISSLDGALRANVAEGTNAVASLDTTPQESLKLPVPLPLNQRRPGSSVRACNTPANSVFIAPPPLRPSSNSSVLPTLASLHGLGNSVGRFADRARVGEGMMVKDDERCPLCHREPYMTRAIGVRPYGGTSYVYADGRFTKVSSV